VKHVCHVPGCMTPVKPDKLMCRADWALVPDLMRQAVYATYRPGQEVTKSPSREYVRVALEACRYVAALKKERIANA
jgi:hypothetical protein